VKDGGWKAGAYLTGERWLERCYTGVRAIYLGVWLGLMDRETLHETTERQYIAWPSYSTTEHNASGLHDWEEKVLAEHFGSCRSLLIGAAGGGREMFALFRRGMAVDGFECCGRLAECARGILAEAGVEGRILTARPDEVPEGLGVYDGAIVGWSAYMHIPGRGNRVAFLKQCRDHIRPGGPILLSFFTRPENGREFRWVYAVASAVRRLRRCSDKVELGDKLMGAFEHFFTREEVEGELEEGGFRLESYAERPYGHAVGRRV
jgi:hypothetical protein